MFDNVKISEAKPASNLYSMENMENQVEIAVKKIFERKEEPLKYMLTAVLTSHMETLFDQFTHKIETRMRNRIDSLEEVSKRLIDKRLEEYSGVVEARVKSTMKNSAISLVENYSKKLISKLLTEFFSDNQPPPLPDDDDDDVE